MSKWITCFYDGKTKTAQYQDARGGCLLRQGGTLPWRTNNPGNLRPRMVNGKPSPKKIKSHIGFAKTNANGYFLIFPSYEIGFQELKNNLRRMHGNKSVANAIRGYAPAHENNTYKYIDDLERLSGISRNTIINTLSDSQLNDIGHAIERIEGYHNDKETRKEIITKLSQVTITDGTLPIVGQPVLLKSGNIKKELITNKTGQLPPIPHHLFDSKINLYVPDIKSNGYKLFSTFDPAKDPRHMLLTFNGLIVKAKTMPLDPPQGEPLPERRKFQYTIKSGDTLSALAKKFKTTVSAIAEANNISNPSIIFPGKKIWILLKAESSDAINKAPSSLPKTLNKNPAKNKNINKKSTSNIWGAPKLDIYNIFPFIYADATRNGKGKPIAIFPVHNEAPWMDIAIREAQQWKGIGEKKIGDNYHSLTSVGGRLSDTPWCASFANYCLKESGYAHSRDYPQSSQFPAYDGRLFVEVAKPVYGAIVVLRTYTRAKNKFTGFGHITFVYGKTSDGSIVGLGGNQGGGKFGGGTIKLSEYKVGEPVSRFLMTIKGVKNVPVYQKIYKYYVPAAYFTHANNDNVELSVVDINDINARLFGLTDQSASADEGGGR